MNKEQFHKLMEKWLSKQMDAAPDLRPTDELYDAVKEKRQKPHIIKFPIPLRWGSAIAAAAAVAFILFLQTDIFRFPAGEDELLPVVGIREGYPTGKGVKKRGPEHGKGRGDTHVGKVETFFDRLEFQYQKLGSDRIMGIYVRDESMDMVKISADDNYRLSIELRYTGYLYIYQLSSDSNLVRLFPDSDYSFLNNPLAESQRYLVPSPPNWFHLDDNKGGETIYFAWSDESLQEWDELYTKYTETKSSHTRKALLDTILQSFAEPSDDIILHTFTFENL